MKLKRIMRGINYSLIKGELDKEIRKIKYDSRKIDSNDLFVSIPGILDNGDNYIDEAIKNGAKVIITENPKLTINADGITVLKVDNARTAMAEMAINYYNNPATKLKLIAVTGTNGKTTTTYFIKNILDNLGYKTGLIGTIENYIGTEHEASKRTTPESVDLQKLFCKMVKENVEYCIMEVSSHSLALNRVHGIKFDIAVFTNLTHEHLDFHKTMDNYYNTKYKLFKNSNLVIVNADSEYSQRLINDLSKDKIKFTTFGIEKNAKYKLLESNIKEDSLSYTMNNNLFKYNIPGRYNIYNSLGAACVLSELGIKMNIIAENMNLKTVPGRYESLKEQLQSTFDVIIDFAHTPDGLKNLLTTVRGYNKRRIISVYGCGGDKDKSKRALLGKVGTDYSDIAIITSDNPRDESPMQIIRDIEAGIEKENYLIIENRREAIEKAISLAEDGDVVVLAGKGHETKQINMNNIIPFDERKIVKEIVKKIV